MSEVFLVCSEKKDIGKTLVTIKTAIQLSNTGKKVLILDLSSGSKKVSEYLNVTENIIYDIKDVLDETCSIEQATININERLSILPYPRMSNKFGRIKKDIFKKIIALLKEEYNAIIVDIDGLSSCYYIDFNDIDGFIIVDNNDFSSIKNINVEYDISKKYEIKKKPVIINRYNKHGAKKGLMLSLKELKKMTAADILGIIEEDILYNYIDYNFLFGNGKSAFDDAIEDLIKLL